MRVSFDLDDTLICQPSTPTEPRLHFWQRWIHPEPLRLGAVTLIHDLQSRGVEIWIYTTSYRSPRSIRSWLRAYKVKLTGVINQDRHNRIVGRSGPSKFPPAFEIDLHVDDLEGVAIEGRRHGFAVVTVAPNNVIWTEAIKEAVDLAISSTTVASRAISTFRISQRIEDDSARRKTKL